ncbi:MAG: hypothetical protein M0033_10905 [Nitrospiraceae bacterium]|nr:hypothetical protein [Nitrospiraceae bacterium]
MRHGQARQAVISLQAFPASGKIKSIFHFFLRGIKSFFGQMDALLVSGANFFFIGGLKNVQDNEGAAERI